MQVQIGTYWYVQLVRTGMDINHTRFILKLLQQLSYAYKSLLNAWLVTLAQRFLLGSRPHSETTQARGLQRPNIQSQVLSSYALLHLCWCCPRGSQTPCAC
jgi:hypothetical protein